MFLNFYKEKGFTLLELLIVIGIITLIGTITASAFFSFRARSDITSEVEKIVDILRLARSNTIGSKEASNYGVHFATSSYILFSGLNYDPADPENEEFNVSNSAEIYFVSFSGGGSDVVFNRIAGDTSNFGNIRIRLKNKVSEDYQINIWPSGGISVSSSVSSGGTNRVQDSRHVHFHLGWSIQNSAALKFYFVNIPSTETVDITNNLKDGQTEFSWQGSFEKGGATQEFLIHTHSLDSVDTDLCVHRDRNGGKNTEEVLIYITKNNVDEYIAHYRADTDDTVEKGTSVLYEMEIQ